MLRRLAAFSIAFSAFAQDPYVTLPRNYRLEFENDYVRVSRVKQFPGDKLPVHSHPGVPTVYVYLTDAGPTRFTHKAPEFTLVRPPVKAGGVRFNRNAAIETHEVEYLGDQPAEYVRIELKTQPGPRHHDARLKEDGQFPWEDPQVRIERMTGLPEHLRWPAVLVDLPQRTILWRGASDNSPVAAGRSEKVVVVELKTRPAADAGN